MSYEQKILQMKKLLQKKVPEEIARPTFKKPTSPTYTQAWQASGLELVENDFGVLFRRVVHYPSHYMHGDLPLSRFFDVRALWEDAELEHPYALEHGEDVLFFDTETTGLKGVGTYIFLLGFLEPSTEGFTLTQYILADPANETALLFESKLWKKRATIISYNGKSFDWPQLQTRWTLSGQAIPKLREQRQIDLLHSSKRIWKDDVARMKLKTVEEEKLGFTRKDDIPGFLAPIIYLDAVKSGNPSALMKVLLHNEWDLLSLITLYSRSTLLLFDDVQHEDSAVTYTNIGKWYADLKVHQQSTQMLEKVTTQFDVLAAKDAHFYLAKQYKREKNYDAATQSYLKAIHFVDERKQLHIYEDLAIMYEHHYKEYDHALRYANEAINIALRTKNVKAKYAESRVQSLQKRMERLTHKKNTVHRREKR